ncbi:3-dehydroquinate synthase [Mesobacillus subterraneus]|uniref:3-dehydroquinate synthase n=1 Tax=Mesobacillus subterraneus TaxID=285983 RepID=A0A3R9F0N8_9BACI|nr:3-dehydroquinate synthase [Mesobacillus subterraneus]RSD26502.1 3-dehydroquinate synthase [Mesobacillus subterraneus]
MQEISIHTDSKTYPVHIGKGIIKNLAEILEKNAVEYTTALVISDETVAKHHLSYFREQSGMSNDLIVKVVPSGEKAKTFDVYYDCLSFALENKLDRKSLIISFGGGAVGDLAGFVAATYMRGIRFIQVPTTILAHDSAVGGKVAINHPLGKNMIGAFHQPEAVVYDMDFLSSLPEKEVRSGFAEVVKHSLISDVKFYDWLRNEIRSLRQIEDHLLVECLTKGIQVKGKVVSEDEKEMGVRAYLNFGHTLAHAIEAEAGYGKITHGEAVAIGMLFALRLSSELKGLAFDIEMFKSWLGSLGFPNSIPEGLSAERLLTRMKQDKKSVGGTVRFVLLSEVGSPVLEEVEEDILMKNLKKFEEEGRT